ncbi:MAG: hypothetical protein Q9162_003097 [Coniocarpon cinnabarinum]
MFIEICPELEVEPPELVDIPPKDLRAHCDRLSCSICRGENRPFSRYCKPQCAIPTRSSGFNHMECEIGVGVPMTASRPRHETFEPSGIRLPPIQSLDQPYRPALPVRLPPISTFDRPPPPPSVSSRRHLGDTSTRTASHQVQTHPGAVTDQPSSEYWPPSAFRQENFGDIESQELSRQVQSRTRTSSRHGAQVTLESLHKDRDEQDEVTHENTSAKAPHVSEPICDVESRVTLTLRVMQGSKPDGEPYRTSARKRAYGKKAFEDKQARVQDAVAHSQAPYVSQYLSDPRNRTTLTILMTQGYKPNGKPYLTSVGHRMSSDKQNAKRKAQREEQRQTNPAPYVSERSCEPCDDTKLTMAV